MVDVALHKLGFFLCVCEGSQIGAFVMQLNLYSGRKNLVFGSEDLQVTPAVPFCSCGPLGKLLNSFELCP